jgi:hypothetical protein
MPMSFEIGAFIGFALACWLLINPLVKQRVSRSYVSYYYRRESPIGFWISIFFRALCVAAWFVLLAWAFIRVN